MVEVVSVQIFDSMEDIESGLNKMQKSILKGETLCVDVIDTLKEQFYDIVANNKEIIARYSEESGWDREAGISTIQARLRADFSHMLAMHVDIPKLADIVNKALEKTDVTYKHCRFELRLIITSSKVRKFTVETYISCKRDKGEPKSYDYNMMSHGAIFISQEINMEMNNDSEPYYKQAVDLAIQHMFDVEKERQIIAELPGVLVKEMSHEKRLTKELSYTISYGLGAQAIADRIYGKGGQGNTKLVDRAKGLISKYFSK